MSVRLSSLLFIVLLANTVTARAQLQFTLNPAAQTGTPEAT